MKELGVDKTNDPIVIGKAIAKDLKDRAEKDKGFSPYRHLQLHGFGNQQDRNVIMDFAGMYNTDKLAKIEAAQNAPLQIGADGKGVIDQRFKERLGADPFLQRKQADTLVQLGDAEKAMQQEPIRRRKAGGIRSAQERRQNVGRL